MTARIPELDLDDRAETPAPLADRMRPTSLDEVVGHRALLAPGGFVRTALGGSSDIPSLVFWGPPGSGKTTLARLFARHVDAHFEPFSAVLGGVAQIRRIVKEARARRGRGVRTLLFVDEIHRFNKGQQDALLPHVEDGTLLLIGATTENPSFALNSALLSRARVVRLEALDADAIVVLLRRALTDPERGLGRSPDAMGDGVLRGIAEWADGDARRALNDLELVARHADQRGQALTLEGLGELFARRTLRHDRAGDGHYDVASAFIKSLRGSDPDAALYYMARLLEAGDDPRFICRRMLIFAAEDVGNADPKALSIAVSAAQAYEMIGMPEGRIVLGQAATYLALAPKSNASYVATDAALALVRETGTLPVPMHLRNAPTALMKELGAGDGYRYPHDHDGWVPAHYLPDAVRDSALYRPTERGYERHIADRLRRMRAARGDASE